MSSDMMEIDNDIRQEYDAFVPMEIDADIITESKIQLYRYVLNVDLGSDFLPSAKEVLKAVDYIHKRAFGQATGIQFNGRKYIYPGGFSAIVPSAQVNASLQPELCILSEKKDDSEKIILIAILSFCTLGAKHIADIWSVAKNPKINFPSSFEVFVKELKKINLDYYTRTEEFALIVGQDNTYRMTEQGRLRLYSSVGFNFIPGTLVQLNYPPGNYEIVSQKQSKPGIVYIQKQGTTDVASAYLGSLKSVDSNTAMKLSATRENLGVKRDIYVGFEDCFKGKTWLSLTMNENQSNYTLNEMEGDMKDNNAVSLDSVLGGNGSDLYFFKTCYHMSLEKKNIQDNNYIDYIDVPKDFVICTITSPGSILWTTGEKIDSFLEQVYNEFRANPNNIENFIRTNKSTAKLPIYNVQSESDLRSIYAKKAEGATKQKTFLDQFTSSIYNSIIIDCLGRQPIYEFPTTDPQIRKYQLDVQIYTEGMRMFNYTLGRNSHLEHPNGRNPTSEDAGKTNDNDNRMGTFKIKFNKDTQRLETKKQAGDDDFVNQFDHTFEEYLNYVQELFPLPAPRNGKPPKYFLFVFGCAAVNNTENYELLYELSHRRSIVHRFPNGTGLASKVFIDSLLRNKLCDPYDCPVIQSQFLGGGKKKKRVQHRMATRFKKLRTRKLKYRKALKTRKLKGGSWFSKGKKINKIVSSIAPKETINYNKRKPVPVSQLEIGKVYDIKTYQIDKLHQVKLDSITKEKILNEDIDFYTFITNNNEKRKTKISKKSLEENYFIYEPTY